MLNNTMTRLLLAAACLMTLIGCATPYTPARGEKTTTAKLLGYGSPSMCIQDKVYGLEVKESGGVRTVELPVDNRVTLRAYIDYQGYPYSASCMPKLSLVPKAGTVLIINTGLADGACFIEAVREDKSRDTGVALEPTVDRPAC